MLFRRGLLLSLVIASALASFHSDIFAASRKKSSHAVASHQASKTSSPPTSRFSWMLPKTVFDVTVNYTFKSCQVDKDGKAHLSMAVAATVTPNAVPDFYTGRMGYDTGNLVSLLNDGSISITTYSGTDILNSLGSNPVDETATVVGNILGGVAKIAGIAFGGGALESAAADVKAAPEAKAPPAPAPATATATAQQPCPFIKKDVSDKGDQLASAQQQLETLQAKLATTTDDNTQKSLNSQITALQNLVAAYTKDLSLQVKTTIDPGFSPAVVTNSDNNMNPYARDGVTPIPLNGLVTTIRPTAKAWQSDENAIPIPTGSFDVNVYLDFKSANVPVAPDGNGYSPRQTAKATVYREVTYIPVTVWWGDKDSKPSGDQPSDGQPKQLIPPQAMPFGQFGQDRALPFSAGQFQNLKWSVTFSQFGEVASANYASSAVAVQATSLFQTAASTASSIAAAQQKANNAENQATNIQGQADLIYQQHRLEQCQASPAACPSK